MLNGLRCRAIRGVFPAAFVTAVLGACAVAPEVQSQAPAAAQTPPAERASSDSYTIGPEDVLNVFVWGQAELSDIVRVRPDGRITTPLVEDIVAVGKTPSQLAREVEGVLARYVRTPQVTVIVEEFVGTFASQVRVLGEVLNPGPIAYRDGLTALDAVLEAGGLTEFASGRRAKLSRTVDGELVETRIRLDRLLEGDLRENEAIRPGDVIFVPQAVF